MPGPRTAVDGVIITGDTAGLVSAKITCEVAAKAVSSGDNSGWALMEYEEWTGKIHKTRGMDFLINKT